MRIVERSNKSFSLNKCNVYTKSMYHVPVENLFHGYGLHIYTLLVLICQPYTTEKIQTCLALDIEGLS